LRCPGLVLAVWSSNSLDGSIQPVKSVRQCRHWSGLSVMKSITHSELCRYLPLFTWALLVAAVTPSSAEPAACASKLRDCFSLSNVQRNICFQVTSRLEQCQGTPDGALAAKRGTFSSLVTPESQDGENDMPPEPMIFDKDCVENFDTLWLSHLVNDDHSPETCENLLGALNECAKQPSFELLRP
jgi:hypothetical protein